LIAINVLGQHIDSASTSSSASSELEKPDSEQNNNGTGHQSTTAPPTHSTNTGNNNAQLLVTNPKYTSPYDDLAFEMYVDPEVARIIRNMEAKKQQAVICKFI
jgi:heme-binding NEAT domain protein